MKRSSTQPGSSHRVQFDLFAGSEVRGADKSEPARPQREAALAAGSRAGTAAAKATMTNPPVRPAALQPVEAEPVGRRLIDVREAARRLGLSKSTLDKMRCTGSGPPFVRATGRAVRYDVNDLAEFASARRQRTTRDTLPATTE